LFVGGFEERDRREENPKHNNEFTPKRPKFLNATKTPNHENSPNDNYQN
jgi:hypothetical protein